MTQIRWTCQQCQREWVYAANWDEQSCPVCRSPRIERVTYTPLFAGADYRTTTADVADLPPPSEPAPAIDPKQVHIHDNQTLALACPEFA